MAPRVSVIVPTYNQPAFLLDAVASVFAQTFTDFELIVVDDGSLPATREALAPVLPRIRYIYQDNAGQSAARNRGAAAATGAYLAFLDHDDRFEPDYLAAAVACLDARPDVGLVASGQRILAADGTPTPRTIGKRSAGERYTTVSLLEGDVGTIVNPVVRRTVFERAGGYDTAIHGPEDCDLWLRISFLAEMVHLPEPRYLYRVHAANTSRDMLTNAREWLRLLDKLEREHADFAAGQRALIRKNRAKQLLRLGREALARSAADPALRIEARSALRSAIRCRPGRAKTWLYWLIASIPGAGRAYAAFRRRELATRERLIVTSAAAALKKR